MTANEPRQHTLATYLHVVRRRAWFVLLTAVVCAGAAVGASLLFLKPEYEAKATLAVKDPAADASLLGTATSSGQLPLQVATSHAPQVERPEVVKRVRKELRSDRSLSQLSKSVDIEVDPNSYLVTITGRASKGEDAAKLANAFAKHDAALTSKATRRAYARAADRLERRLKKARGSRRVETAAVYIDRLAQLQSLSSVAEPVAVNTVAKTPKSPASPNLMLNGLAGFLFGLLFGIAIAYAREALDHRLRRSSDVQNYVDHPVVGQVRSSVLEHAVSRRHAGGNGLEPLSDVDQEAFRFIRQNLRFLGNGDSELNTLLVTSPMPQEGKTTVATRLAMETAAAGKRTLLVECDMRRPVLAQRLGLSPTPGLSDYLFGEATPEEILQSLPARQTSENGAVADPTAADSELVCITCGTQSARPADLLASERFSAFLAEVGSVYDCVIVDSAPILAVADTLELVPKVSGILVCIRLAQTTRDQALAADTALARLPECPTAVILTDIEESDDGYYGYYGYYGARPGEPVS